MEAEQKPRQANLLAPSSGNSACSASPNTHVSASGVHRQSPALFLCHNLGASDHVLHMHARGSEAFACTPMHGCKHLHMICALTEHRALHGASTSLSSGGQRAPAHGPHWHLLQEETPAEDPSKTCAGRGGHALAIRVFAECTSLHA